MKKNDERLVQLGIPTRVPPIRSSSLATAQKCPRLFLYQYRLGLHARGYKSPLALGTLFHKALASLFLGTSLTNVVESLVEEVSRTTSKLILEAPPTGMLFGTPVEKVVDSMKIDLWKAVAMAQIFWEHSPVNTRVFEVMDSPIGCLVEKVIQVEVPGISVPIRFPCDLVIRNKESGEVWIVDHKTTSMRTDVRAKGLVLGSQGKLYRLGLQKALDSWGLGRVVGVVYNVIQKPTIKFCPDTKDKGGITDYVARMREWYSEKSKAGEHPLLQMWSRFSGPPEDPELMVRLKEHARMSKARIDLDEFYRAGDSVCHDFNSPCPFLDICGTDPATWRQALDQKFEIAHREDGEEDVTIIKP